MLPIHESVEDRREILDRSLTGHFFSLSRSRSRSRSRSLSLSLSPFLSLPFSLLPHLPPYHPAHLPPQPSLQLLELLYIELSCDRLPLTPEPHQTAQTVVTHRQIYACDAAAPFHPSQTLRIPQVSFIVGNFIRSYVCLLIHKYIHKFIHLPVGFFTSIQFLHALNLSIPFVHSLHSLFLQFIYLVYSFIHLFIRTCSFHCFVRTKL